MLIVREFETMLGDFKARGAYAGIEFAYKGPAHLSIGQEGAAVGAAMALSPEDHIFGSHRSHGEFIAKGLSAIDRLDERRLMNIMEMEQGGRVLSAVHRFIKPASETALAESFMLFGFLSEIFMRATGFNGGMGGSMHAFFLPFGAYPNNAIVGASAGIATGAALHKKLQREKRHRGRLRRRRLDRLRPGLRGDEFCAPWRSTTGCGPSRTRAGCRCSSSSPTISTPWAARPAARPWAGTACRGSARG